MPFIPLHDENPRLLIRWPWVTWGLMAGCVLIHLLVTFTDAEAQNRILLSLGFMPALLSGNVVLPEGYSVVPAWFTLVSYQFLHGGWAHLCGNMLFLWVFGDNIEDALGHLRFMVFFLLSGIIGALAQFAIAPHSEITLIGASGAVSGVLAAYLLLHPKARVWIPIVIIPVFLPAWLLLIGWFGLQLFQGVLSSDLPNVAWWAHIGGFVAGIPLYLILRRREIPLFGQQDLPSGITLRDAIRRKHWENRRQRRPWG